MSNYPPGVSGHEPQIAGYPEKEEARTMSCEADDGGSCSFEGTLIVTVFDIGGDEAEIQWDCPLCKRENISYETIDRGPDPDDQRDRANDDRGI